MNTNWVLLADDDLEDQEMLKDMFTQMDDSIKVESVSDGREALTKLKELPETELPSLVILDYKMPYLSAGEVLEALQPDARYANVPKVCWSSSRREEDIKRCMKAGACNYFQKPSNTSELRSMAQKMLECRDNSPKDCTHIGK